MVSGKKHCKQKHVNFFKKISFQTQKGNLHTIAKKSPIKYAFPAWNRGPSCIAFRKASLTVETAMILPVFLFFFLGMVYIIYALSLEVSVKSSLYETGKELAEYAYLTEAGEKYSENAEEYFGAGAYAFTAARFCSYMGNEYWDRSIINNGSKGFSFSQSIFLDESGIIDLVVRYDIKIPFLFTGELSFPQVQRCRLRGWIGSKDNQEAEEEMVYITESGSVYHRSLDCQHLKVNIRTVLPLNMATERNQSGAKYYPCVFCGNAKLKDGVYYVTSDGDRFHTSKLCSGLKRKILTVPITDVDGRSACKRCGGG